MTTETKTLRCKLGLHTWAKHWNDEGQDYYLCARCDKYHESFHLVDSSGGIA